MGGSIEPLPPSFKFKMKEQVRKTKDEEQIIKDIKRILKDIQETEKQEGILTIKVDKDFYSLFKIISSDKKEVTKNATI